MSNSLDRDLGLKPVGLNQYAQSRGEAAVRDNLEVRFCEAWAAIGPIEISGDYITKMKHKNRKAR